MKAVARLETERASRYIQAMCKHFAHKIEVEYDEQRGRAKLPEGELLMTVGGDGALQFEVTAPDVQGLLKSRYTVDAHIVRFAFREGLLGLDWSSRSVGE